ncbi:hypothetical protein WJX73_000070 [Symbiochloris irregularis]|uniref:FAD-binding FR-type domain-containing protein n=1 Tax=Symbiochloris irregularis TaxID=706552 RepID=A0AAW1NW67_9CHLO
MDTLLHRLQVSQARQASQVCNTGAASFSGRLPPSWVPAERAAHSARVPALQAGATPQSRAATAALEEEDLIQFPDRVNWYKAKFVANDAPDWTAGRFVLKREAAPNLREVTFEVEISREKIPLRNGYRHIGQQARVRISGGVEVDLAVASPPFALVLNKDPLFLARNDMTAGQTKTTREEISIMAELTVLVPKKDDLLDAWNVQDDSSIEIGPFQGAGMNLRGPIRSIWAYPTLVIFVEGLGIGTARSLVEADVEVGALNLSLRQEVRMYYRAPNQEALLYKDRYEDWERLGCKVVTSTRDTFMEMFDNDDTLSYDPFNTAAIILTGNDEEAEEAALEVCKEAEITEIARDSVEQQPTKYLE